MKLIRVILFSFLAAVFVLPTAAIVHAEEKPVKSFRDTDLPLPRFVSLAVDKANMRTGPGRKYPIKWVYKRKYMPVEIIQEFEHWRKIKDFDGEQGWVHKSLLSGRRTALVISASAQADETKVLRAKAEIDSKIIAKLEIGVTADILRCESEFCKVTIGGYSGWLQRKFIYGIYEDEELN